VKEDAKFKKLGLTCDAYGDSRSSAISPFDGAYTTSYSTFIKYLICPRESSRWHILLCSRYLSSSLRRARATCTCSSHRLRYVYSSHPYFGVAIPILNLIPTFTKAQFTVYLCPRAVFSGRVRLVHGQWTQPVNTGNPYLFFLSAAIRVFFPSVLRCGQPNLKPTPNLCYSSVHTTRVHGPCSRVSKMTPVFTGSRHGP